MFSAASKTDNVSSAANYIEDVFSTYLYTGNGSTQNIVNGIDLSTYGGLIWSQIRSGTIGTNNGALVDTVRGINSSLVSNSTSGATGGLAFSDTTSFNTNGFSLGYVTALQNRSGNSMASWTFRKQPKFFDVVTYTGNGASTQTISHNLGVVPGCIIVKKTSSTSNWSVYHRSLSAGSYLKLNLQDAQAADSFMNGANAPTSTTFTAQLATSDGLNANGATYVAYLFAHNAGGFGLTGTDNVISCGSYTGTSGTQQINLGFEPQWILVKDRSTPSTDWILIDNMRGMSTSSTGANVDKALRANANIAEYDSSDFGATATGFIPGGDVNNSGNAYIYIAIRRGPMKTPTSGTSVYKAITRTGTGATATITGAGFPPDMVLSRDRGNNGVDALLEDRLRGATAWMTTTGINAEATRSDALTSFANMDGVAVGADSSTQAINWTNFNYVTYFFRRAPGFMDVVCYSGTGSNTTQTHNLGVTPELIIVKRRGATSAWPVYSAALANTEYLVLNTTAAKATGATYWNSTTPTSTVFSLGTAADVNASGSTGTYVAYLFASCPGVSKVGTYSGTGGTQTISCGFAARWVMIRRTDSTGDWWFWDTTRGMVAGNDRRLAMNLIDQEVNANWVYTDASGFQIVTTDATVNASGGTYIYLAIA